MRDGEKGKIARLEPYTPPADSAEPERPPFKIVRWFDLAQLPEPEPLIKHLIDRAALSVIFGASNSGKTFFALDMALHVALGWERYGLKVRQGAALYIAAEAGRSISNRLTAFRHHHNIEVDDVAFYVMPDSLDMCQGHAQTDQLIGEIAGRFTGVAFELIVLDTLARVMGGGNENAPDDMGALIANCDRLRRATGAHVMLVHHTGKDMNRAERGHSALRAAVDTAIEVTHDETAGLHVATVQKQRDRQAGQVFGFKLLPVEIGKDEDEDPITSCVVSPSEGGTAPKTKRKPLSPAAKLALDELHNCIIEHAGDPTPTPSSPDIPASVAGVSKTRWRTRLEKAGIINADGNPREQQKRIIVALKDAGRIGVWGDFVWPVTGRHKDRT